MRIDIVHFNLSKSGGFPYVPPGFTFKKILHGSRWALSVLYGSHNRQRPLLYT